MNMIIENTNLKWNIRIPKGLLLTDKLSNKQKLIAIILYQNAHGRAKTKLTLQELSDITGIPKSTVNKCLTKIQTITKKTKKKEITYIKSQTVITCKGKISEYKLFYDNLAYQPIPQEVFDRLIKINPELIVHYATLRYAHWYLTYKDPKQQLDITNYAKIMGLKDANEYNEVQIKLAEAGVLKKSGFMYEFDDGLDDETLK